MFFPFDPYLLRRSSAYLQLKASYRRWRHGQPVTAAQAEHLAGAQQQRQRRRHWRRPGGRRRPRAPLQRLQPAEAVRASRWR
jgi:hypothetical protein